MNLMDYVDKAETLNLDDLKNKTFVDIIAIFHAKNLSRVYILKDKRPIFVITPKEIVNIFFNNLQNENVFDYLKEKEFLSCLDAKLHIIDAYYQMRRDKLDFMPVCENNKFIGEIDFNALNLKITYVVIKDELSKVYNRKYFDVIIEEYKDFDKPIGIICIEIKDLPIFEGLYGIDMVFDIIKNYANILKNSVRNIDFVFRWDNQFRIMVFNNFEVTAKIFERIKNKLENLKINDIHIPFSICMTHIPEVNEDIVLALEECEEKLIKRD